MPLQIVRQDITKMKVCAIVNPTNEKLEPTGGTDLAIHKAAGEKLAKYCSNIAPCNVAQAKITPAYELDCRYVIHTVGPVWDGSEKSEELLYECYTNCLNLASAAKCESVAFPLISSGAYGFPKDKVLKIATKTVSDFLYDHEMTVFIVVYDKDSYEISNKIYSDVKSYIDDNYVSVVFDEVRRAQSDYGAVLPQASYSRNDFEEKRQKNVNKEKVKKAKLTDCVLKLFPSLADEDEFDLENVSYEDASLEDMLSNMDKGFGETLFYYIDKKGMTDIECYKRSNVDKKTFSKIKCNSNYKPSKITAVSFAIGLRLTLQEASHLLSTAGMCLSHSDKSDVIIEYFLKTGNYTDIFEVNEILYKFDRPLLGV